jgi:uncharacterized protein YecE (DUF72 family)
MAKQGKIRVGIGGWTFEPWRGVFYPKGLSQAKELGYASQHVTSIEVNGTFYSTQKPATFAKWRSETPEGFVFSIKGIRYAVNRRVLAEAGDSINRFLDSGVTELGDRLGPMLWQFAGTKKFDEADFGKFLELLPAKLGGTPLRHVVEPRHVSFCTPAFISLIRQFSIQRSPIPSATSCICACRRARTTSRPAIRPRRWTSGPSGRTRGQPAARPRTCR